MSAERHLKVDMSDEESDTIDTIKQNMQHIIDIVVAGDALQNLRQNLKTSNSFKYP